jgi:hypothetical protein
MSINQHHHYAMILASALNHVLEQRLLLLFFLFVGNKYLQALVYQNLMVFFSKSRQFCVLFNNRLFSFKITSYSFEALQLVQLPLI